ncbi:MAG: autotransporter domain-containing protein [Betaproteobacteria bacterium]
MHFQKRLLATAIAFGLSSAAQAFEFTNAYILGDSLSDAGQYGARFTTNPGLTASEYLAIRYGFTLKPSTQGGTDYAFGGARVTTQGTYNPQATPVGGQVTALITASGGTLDSGALYILQGGPNDIFYHVGLVGAGAESSAAAQAAVGVAATDFLANIVRLRAAGARYIVVMNLPDMGRTPAGTAGGAAAIGALSGLSVSVFNSILNNGLNSIGFDVIPANVQGLFGEILANPSLYGITNTTIPACTVSSSLACTPNTLVNATAPNNYLFADGVHPTTAAHKLVAQYIASIITAPEQIGLLAEAPMAVSAGQGRLIEARTQAPSGPKGSANVYGSYEFANADIDSSAATIGSKGDVSALNVGGDLQLTDDMRAGILFGYSENKADFGGGTGGFKLKEAMFTTYAAINRGLWYAGGSFGAGDLKYKNVHRNIELGPAVRTEAGTTKGNHIVAKLVGGMNFSAGNFSHGPIASVTYQQIKVNGFAEDGAASTTMLFTEQTRKSLLTSIGYLVSTRMGIAQPWVRVAWENEHKNDGREVRASLVTMGGSFGLPAYKVDDNYGKVDVGVAAEFSKGLSGYVNYNTTFSQANQKNQAVMVGLRVSM